jgi:hypothetical protein
MPGGGDCEGATGATTNSHDMELLLAGKMSAAASINAKLTNSGVIVAGGVCGLAEQQPASIDSQGMLICEQQLWVGCCAGSTQVPTESSNTPIRVMATAVRWATLRSMVSGYHVLRALR